MVNLTCYDIAYIGLKLLIIYLALQVIGSLPSWVATLLVLFEKDLAVDSTAIWMRVFAFIVPLLTLCLPFLGWCFSSRIASFMTRTSDEKPDTLAVSSIESRDLQSILFCAIGVFILITIIPELALCLYTIIHAHILAAKSLFPNTIPQIPLLITLLLKVALSLSLIFTAKSLSVLLNKFCHAGLVK